MVITKSDFLLYLKHPAWLWLKKHRKDVLPPVDANTQAVFDAGHQFEQYVECLFPDSKKLGFNDFNEYGLLPILTRQAVASSVKTIFQGRFEVDGLTCIFDVLDRVSGTVFNLYEIKSSTKVKAEHESDLAFQVIVLEKAGLKIGKIGVIHVNSQYVKKGPIDPQTLTQIVDITQVVRSKIEIVTNQIHAAKAVVRQKTMPDMSPRFATGKGFSEWVKIFLSLKSVEEDSIYTLSSLSADQVGQFEDEGIVRIGDIREEIIEKKKQLNHIRAVKSNQRLVDTVPLAEFLASWQYPYYFLDYETYAQLVPTFDGQMPYKDYPFQYSLHVLTANGDLKHFEYLHGNADDPTKPLVERLISHIGQAGTIVSWNQSYEKNINKTLALLYPEYAEKLSAINDRMVDLMVPFDKGWVIDKGFMGSASIKKVLPVMAAELSYEHMAVADGQTARNIWMQTVLENQNPHQKAQVMNDLKQYCKLDTFAMVRIWQELQAFIGNRIEFLTQNEA